MESICYYTVFSEVKFFPRDLINFEFLVKTIYNLKISSVIRSPFMKMYYVTLIY